MGRCLALTGSSAKAAIRRIAIFVTIRHRKARKIMARIGKKRHSIKRASGEVFGGGRNGRIALYRLKRNSTPEELFNQFPKVISKRSYLDFVYGSAFPSELTGIFSVHALFAPTSTINEIVWAICRCAMYSSELSAFAEARARLEHHLLLGNHIEAAAHLSDIHDRFGASLWFCQAVLSTPDAPAFANFRMEIAEAVAVLGESSISGFMLAYLSRRAESQGAKTFLSQEVGARLTGVDESFQRYAEVRITDVSTVGQEAIAPLLSYEGQASVIDHYEMLIMALRRMASARTLPPPVIKAVERPLLLLYRKLSDRRLTPILRGIGIPVDLKMSSGLREEAFEAYARSDYLTAASLAERHLMESDATDAAALCLVARSRVRAGTLGGQLSKSLETICGHMFGVLSGGDSAYADATSIFSICDRNYGQTWAIYLRNVVSDCLSEDVAVWRNVSLVDICVYDTYDSPLALMAARGAAASFLRDDLSKSDRYPLTSLAVKVILDGVDAAGKGLSLRKVGSYLARHYLDKGEFALAASTVSTLLPSYSANHALRVRSAGALAYAGLGDAGAACAWLVDGYLANPMIPTALPLGAVAEFLASQDDLPSSIDVPIALELHNEFSSNDQISRLRVCFELFQETHGIKRPADLVEKFGPSDREKVILFLARVWTPEVMRQTLLYDGSDEIEDARIAVCRQLATFDEDNAKVYLEEIRDRVKRQEIAKGTSLVEQSKVFVDIAAIKKGLKAKIGGQYTRYKNSAAARPQFEVDVIGNLANTLHDLSVEHKVSIGKLMSRVHLMDDGETEVDSQFDSIFTEVTNEFLRGDHGLNAYLSTRVRHGTLANTLRKPVADEQLFTVREKVGSGVSRNEFWGARLSTLLPDQLESIMVALSNFTKNADEIVALLKDTYLQIKISHGVTESRENMNALFVYRSSNLERRFMQRFVRSLSSIDDFIDLCIESLWEKTDANLRIVQEAIEGDIRLRFMKAFDELSDTVARAHPSQPVSDLKNAIYRARTGLHQKLKEVSSWFTRREVYDRQDYLPLLPIDIALNMIEKTMPDNSVMPSVEKIVTPSSGSSMPGRTLDGMVDAFYGVLVNAMKYSGISGADLVVRISIGLDGDRFAARIESPLAPGLPTEAERARVDQIRDALEKPDSRHKAQIEGGSGLYKLWRSINSPFYSKPVLTFNYTPSQSFVVEMEFDLEKAG
jgi:hypothetical protein